MINKLEKYNLDYLNELFCSYYILVYNKLPKRESLPKHLLIKRIKRMLKVKIDYENRGILKTKTIGDIYETDKSTQVQS